MSAKAKSALENQYSGDADWNEYVLRCRAQYPDIERNQPELIEALKQHSDVAAVVFQKMGNHSLTWINEKIPALDNLTIVQCLDETHLMNRLREGLLRMPF